jgi:hypothetical protein
MQTKILLLTAFALLALAPPLVGDGPQQLCLCEFVAPTYSQGARLIRAEASVLVIVKVHDDGTISEIWPPGSEMTSEGPINGMSRQSLLAGGPFEVVKKWKFCPGGGDRYVPIHFEFKLTEPAVKGWAPTQVSFHAPATVEITTARFEGEIQRTDHPRQ